MTVEVHGSSHLQPGVQRVCPGVWEHVHDALAVFAARGLSKVSALDLVGLQPEGAIQRENYWEALRTRGRTRLSCMSHTWPVHPPPNILRTPPHIVHISLTHPPCIIHTSVHTSSLTPLTCSCSAAESHRPGPRGPGGSRCCCGATARTPSHPRGRSNCEGVEGAEGGA